MDKKEMHVISHTHWDREWYLTFEEFRIRLVDLIDRLLEILDKDPEYKYFMLDGQTVVVEDYLEIKPENKDKLKKRIREGRILIGPWYVQPDEFLVSSEALIRNLLLGDKICKEFGAKMAEGYLPDSFGHIAQMPQILNGFGIDTAIFSRGVGREVTTTEFIWQAPDGSEVLALYMPYGYGTGMNLPFDTDDCVRRIEDLVNKLSPMSTTKYLLLMNGGDHAEPQPDLSQIIKKVNERLEGVVLLHSTLPILMDKLKQEVTKLPKFRGELRSGERAHIHSGTLSTRMYLKQRNHRVETLLEKWCEPASAFAWMMGEPYPSALIWLAWRYLLRNHAHDSICGCSVDEVHREMLTRFDKAEQIGESVVEKGLRHLAECIDTSGSEVNLIVFNPLQHPRDETLRVVVDVDEQLIDDQSIAHLERLQMKPLPKNVTIYDEQGNIIPCKVRKIERTGKVKLDPPNFPRVYLISRCYIDLCVKDVPGLGYRTYVVKPIYGEGSETGSHQAKQKQQEFVLENEYFKIVPSSENGGLTVHDKRTGRIYRGCNVFVDERDAGDEYAYSPPEKDEIVDSRAYKPEISWVRNDETGRTIKIKTTLHLPRSLRGVFRDVERVERPVTPLYPKLEKNGGEERQAVERVECPISSFISVYPGVKRIDIKTVIENNAEDHRLKVLFPSGVKANLSHAEGHFGIVSRDTRLPEADEWEERPTGTHPQKSFVDVNDGKFGLTIANRGLPEYGVIEEKGEAVIALTLLRCVGRVSRGNLLTRKGYAAPPYPVTDAQCLGEHVFHYSVIPHDGSWEGAKTYIQAHEFNVPLAYVQTGSHPGCLPKKASFIRVKPDNLIISAVKKAEERDSLIVRLYNITSHDVDGILCSYFPIVGANLTGMDEEVRERLVVENNTVKFRVKGWQVVTLELIPKRGEA